MYDDSVLLTDVAVTLGLICNIAAPLAAFWAAGKLPRWRLWFHATAFFTILNCFPTKKKSLVRALCFCR